MVAALRANDGAMLRIMLEVFRDRKERELYEALLSDLRLCDLIPH